MMPGMYGSEVETQTQSQDWDWPNLYTAMENDDILADWKNSRWIVASGWNHDEDKIIVVLTDFEYWAEHAEEMLEWCRNNGAVSKGMTIDLENEDMLTLFTLRWS